MAHEYKFFPTIDYFAELNRSIARLDRGEHIYLATMAFDGQAESTRLLFEHLGEAAKRGVVVKLIVDAMPFLLYAGIRPGPMYYGKSLKGRLKEPFSTTLRMLDELREAGGEYAIINRPSRPLKLPLGGRSHIKFAIINDRVIIGGCNLDSAHHPDIDIMVGWEDAHSAAWLRAMAEKLMSTGHARIALHNEDSCLPLNDHAAILVDAGVPRRSLIMRRAMALIDEAREYVFISCQYFPGQVTGQRLLAARRRGAKICIVYGHPHQHDRLNQRLQRLSNMAERWRLPDEFFRHSVQYENGRIHAKLIATERGAIIGSHNYISAGVRLGTAEIALLTDDPIFGRRAMDVVVGQIGEQGRPILNELFSDVATADS
jgi:cardiolipin synthase